MTSTVHFILFTLVHLTYYVTEVALYLYHIFNAPDPTVLSSGADHAHIVVALAVLGAHFFVWLSWELRYGSALSYFYPLHGARRVRASAWRFGILVKSALLAVLIDVLVHAILTRSYPSLTLHNLILLSQISALESLLVPVCLALPITILLFYALLTACCLRAPEPKRSA